MAQVRLTNPYFKHNKQLFFPPFKYSNGGATAWEWAAKLDVLKVKRIHRQGRI